MKDVKLGFINYSNTVPVYYGILTGKTQFKGQVIRDIPGNLNKMLNKGEIHISPVSSIEYARYQKDYYLLRSFCINSSGYVRSVIMVSKYPLSELVNKTVGLTPASETSRVLLKILFTGYFKINPLYIDLKYVDLKDQAGIDAALLIGDHALAFKNPEYPYCFDLGDLWLKNTGYPVVFALWAVRRDFADRWPEKVKEIEKILNNSYELGKKNPLDVISLAVSLCPDPVCPYEEYYKLLGYRFEEIHKEGLLFFYKKASDLNLCPPCEELVFFE